MMVIWRARPRFGRTGESRLQNGETLQRPLDLFDKAPVQKIEYSKETALVVAEDRIKTPRRRDGAARCCDSPLVWKARPPPPLFGDRPPPRTADEQVVRSGCGLCPFGAGSRRYVQEQLRSRCSLTGGALRDLRARQLLAIFVRSCGSANRGSDVLSVQSAYAACLLRVLKHDAPYPEAWSPSEPLGAQGLSGERRDWATRI